MGKDSEGPLLSATAAGAALGLAAGIGAALPTHDYLFALPGGFAERATHWLLNNGGPVGLFLGRKGVVLLVHTGLGAAVGLGGGIGLRIAGVRSGSVLARTPVLGALAALGAAIGMGWMWSHRGIAAGPGPLLLLAAGLAFWSGAGASLLARVCRWIGAHPRWIAAPFLTAMALVLFLGDSIPHLAETPGDILPVRAPHPVLLIGLDAASWANLGPGIAEGRLPNLARLREQGAYGDLQSLEIALSPIVWTTIVTGQRPEDHGIRDFALDGVPYTSNSRTAWAFWDLLPRFGLRSAFHYWWASWPAEAVDGRIVTDRFDTPGLEGRVHPPDDLPPLEAIMEAARRATPEVSALVGSRGEALPSEFDARHRAKLDVLRRFLERDELVTSMGEAGLRSLEYSLYGVYLRGIDAVGHKFWRWHYLHSSPRLARWVYGPPDADQALLGPVVDRMNELTDAWVGRLLRAAGPDMNVVVVSDHGMTASMSQTAAAGSESETGNHHPSGLLLLAGPDVRPTVVVRGATVYDVFPTILYLLGLPVAENLPGRVLTEALSDDTRRTRPLRRIARYGPRPDGDIRPIASRQDHEYLDRLRELGYVVD